MLAVLRWLALALGSIAGAAALLAVGRVAPTSLDHPLSPPFTAYGEHAFNLRLPSLDRPPLLVLTDGKGRPDSSGVQLFEDGAALGPAHVPHGQIAAEGRGRFSHWGDTLYFSASDNSDPNLNRRTYSVRVPLHLPVEWWGPLAAASALGFTVWLSDRTVRGRVVRFASGCCALVGAGLLLVNGAGLLLPADLTAAFTSRPDDTTLDFEAAAIAIDRARADYHAGRLDTAAFLEAVNTAVNRRMTNVLQRFVDDEHAMAPRVTDNWLLAALNHDGQFDDYEYQDPTRALRRGLGTCGAQAITLLRLLARDGFEGRLWGSGVHVVAQVSSPDGDPFVVDPDYGVVLRGTPDALREDLPRVHDAYSRRLQRSPEEIGAVIESHYRGADGSQFLELRDLAGTRYDAERFRGFDPLEFEVAAFQAKWVVPILLLLPAVVLALFRRRAQRA